MKNKERFDLISRNLRSVNGLVTVWKKFYPRRHFFKFNRDELLSLRDAINELEEEYGSKKKN